MKQALLFFFFLLSMVSFSHAQIGKIKGKIAMENGNPVDGATVTIKPLNRNVIADEKGNYEFNAIPYGKYTLEISSIEIVFKKLELNINKIENLINVSVKANENKTLNEVNIVGKTEKKKIETSGFAVAIIETKEASLRN